MLRKTLPKIRICIICRTEKKTFQANLKSEVDNANLSFILGEGIDENNCNELVEPNQLIVLDQEWQSVSFFLMWSEHSMLLARLFLLIIILNYCDSHF